MPSFDKLHLNPLILKAIQDLGYEKPSQIQAETLPILLGEPTDFLGLAATGTGKTAAFTIPLLERLDPDRLREVQGLILCPTRELALQVAGQVDLLGKHMGVRALPVYGGASYTDQMHGLKRGVPIVVGTPGRIIDHLERGRLSLQSVHTLILDEADEMISMGFKEELERILKAVPEDSSNTWLFSATMSPEVRRVADEYLHQPAQVQINRTEMLPSNVEQLFYATRESDKPEVLCKLIDAADAFYGLIFCQTKALVIDLTQYMKSRGYAVDCLHGDMDQNARERVMKAYRERKLQVLVCTDVASRGLDVKDITHVINYSIPRELDNYVHRIGRTARSGKSGVAMSLVTGSHRGLIGRIERMTRSKMKEGRIPSRKEIGLKKVARILADFQAQTTHARAVDLMSPEWKDALASMSGEEIAGRFLAMTFPEVFGVRAEGGTGVVVKPVGPTSAPKTVAEREERERSHHESKKEYGKEKSRFGRHENPRYAREERPGKRHDRPEGRDRDRNPRFDARGPQKPREQHEAHVHYGKKDYEISGGSTPLKKGHKFQWAPKPRGANRGGRHGRD